MISYFLLQFHGFFFLKDDLNALKSKIKEILKETNDLTEKRNVTNDPMEDKLTLFRQQAAIIARQAPNIHFISL